MGSVAQEEDTAERIPGCFAIANHDRYQQTGGRTLRGFDHQQFGKFKTH